MVRFEKNKLIIEIDCSLTKPEEELISIYQDLLLVLRSQHVDYLSSNKYAMDHMLDFLTEMLISSEQVKINGNKQS